MLKKAVGEGATRSAWSQLGRLLVLRLGLVGLVGLVLRRLALRVLDKTENKNTDVEKAFREYGPNPAGSHLRGILCVEARPLGKIRSEK